MALIRCKECGEEISKKADKCPKCGAPRKKKTSLFTWIIAAFSALFLYVYFSNADYQQDQAAIRPAEKVDPMVSARKNVHLKFSWNKAGFGNVMEVTFIIKNSNPFPIKDIDVECVNFGKSGTRLDSNERTIFDIVPKKTSKEFPNFNMGFINSQTSSTSCRINDFKM